MRIKQILMAVFTVMLMPFITSAQVTTSSMSGAVATSTGEPLVGATVSATHQPSGTVYITTSKGGGQYTIPNMRVGGPYQIIVTYVGFPTQTIDDVSLRLSENSVVNASLTNTATTLTGVTVTAVNRNAILSASRTGTTTNIGTAQINRLPTISRNINDLTRLTPQATSTANGAIGGGNYRQNYITVDGADFNNTFGIGSNLPAGGSPISLDALEEISVNVTPYDVRQSGFIGSAINAVTRSGNNTFNGSVYTFWRSQDQQGNKVGYNDPLVRQDLQINTYGFRLGGPIIKNKLFFFINAESGKTTQPGQLNEAATSAAPFGSSPNITRPTADSLNYIRQYLQDKYGYDAGEYQGYSRVSENKRFVARVDWNINSKNRFNVRYSQVESKSPSFLSTSSSPLSNFTFGVGRTDNNALWYRNSNYFQEANFYSLSAELNSTIGKFSNTLRGTLTHQNDPRSSESTIFPFVDILSAGTPYTSFGYENFSLGNLRDVKTLSFVDNVIWTTGKHTITVGGQADFQSTRNGFQRFAASYYRFNSWSDFATGKNPTDFALTYSLLPGFEQAFPRFKFGQYAVYGQDEIAVSKKLRITVGLRGDLLTYQDVKEIQTHPLVATLAFENGEKLNTGLLPDNKVQWSPRAGFNWDVKGDRSLQVRGGTGVFTGRVPTVWIVSQSGDAGLIQFTQTVSGQANTPGPFNPDPNAYRPATVPAAGTQVPASISTVDPDFKFPQTWKSSLAVDFKLPGGIVATVEGIYNKDLIIALGRNPNFAPPMSLGVPGYPDNRPIYGATVPTRFLNPLTSSTFNATTNPRVNYPVAYGDSKGTGAFNPVVLYNRHDGYYFSAMAKLEKQFGKGIFASVAYIRSEAKTLFDGSGDQLLNTWSLTQIVNNSNNPELSVANYVVPDRLVATLSYRKEYLKHLGTTISLFYEGSIANRFSYTYSTDFNRDGQTNDLIYIPKNASEINFVDQTYGSGSSAVVYTARQQSELFFKYIEQDAYLSAHKGQYAERNGAIVPWRNQVDLKFAQDIFTSIGRKRNTLQFSLDIFNFGNLLNKNWGLFKTINASAILVPRNGTAFTGNINGVATPIPAYTPNGGTRPMFSLATDRNQPVTSTFRQNNSLTSTYYMQFGLRYIFGQ